jgi:hypothetical protein
MDKPEIYKNQTGAGIYYLESNNYIPLSGNGWYYYPMIDYCLANNIIQPSDIKFTVQASLTSSCDHYNKFIDYCYTELPQELQKIAVNAFIGAFKPNIQGNESWTTVGIFEISKEAYDYFVHYDRCFIENFTINDKPYFQIF